MELDIKPYLKYCIGHNCQLKIDGEWSSVRTLTYGDLERGIVIDQVRPILRKLSSMTEEELREWVQQPHFSDHQCKKYLREINHSLFGLHKFISFYGNTNSNTLAHIKRLMALVGRLFYARIDNRKEIAMEDFWKDKPYGLKEDLKIGGPYQIGATVKCTRGRYEGLFGVITSIDHDKYDQTSFIMKVDVVSELVNPDNWEIV